MPDVKLVRDGLFSNKTKNIREHWGNVNQENKKEINVHQISDLDMIWSNENVRNSKHEGKVSIWRARKIEGYYNPGDVVAYGYSSPGAGFLLKASTYSLLDHFKLPVSYDITFKGDDVGLSDLCIWKPICQPSEDLNSIYINMYL